jgi:hypothetical protein
MEHTKMPVGTFEPVKPHNPLMTSTPLLIRAHAFRFLRQIFILLPETIL